jgi:hypothetical protein
MRPQGKIKLGFFPLPVMEAERLRKLFVFAAPFSALDPCVGDGAACAGTGREKWHRRVSGRRMESVERRAPEAVCGDSCG